MRIAKHGLRNSLLVANHAHGKHGADSGQQRVLRAAHAEPARSPHVFGQVFFQVNRHVLWDLIERGLWTEGSRMKLSAHNGSVQSVNLPSDLKSLYKTVWEIEKRSILDMAADRGVYIDQSPSLNIHVVNATTAKISSMRFRGWQLGLKKGMRYLRKKSATDAIKFTWKVKADAWPGRERGAARDRAVEGWGQTCLKPARRHAKARQGRRWIAVFGGHGVARQGLGHG